MSDSQLILYTYYRSSCSGRLRIALNYKALPHTRQTVSLEDAAHQTDTYTHLNPSRTVPCLIDQPRTPKPVVIGQSIAALEYLEEVYPAKPLLPPLSQPVNRAKVRQLVQLVASDMQPLINRKVANAVSDLGGSREKWAKEQTARGLNVFENLLKDTAGVYCVGDEVTMADVVLAPMVWNAEIYGVDLAPMPTLSRVYEETMKLEAFQKAHWREQEDCPEKYRTCQEKLPVV